MTTLSLLSHPITLLMLTGFGTLLGWLFKSAYDNGGAIKVLTKTSEDIKELLMRTIEHQERQDAKLDTIRGVVDRLHTEHEMVKKAGNLIHVHEFGEKKTT